MYSFSCKYYSLTKFCFFSTVGNIKKLNVRGRGLAPGDTLLVHVKRVYSWNLGNSELQVNFSSPLSRCRLEKNISRNAPPCLSFQVKVIPIIRRVSHFQAHIFNSAFKSFFHSSFHRKNSYKR